MKHLIELSLATLILLFMIGSPGMAQSKITVDAKLAKADTTILYHIEMVDGNTYTGYIVKQDPKTIRFRTKNLGLITLIKQDMVDLDIISANQLKEGKYWADHMQSTRYFWQPNGYGLKKGEGYYQNVWILFNQFSVGVTDNFLIGGGLMPLFLFGGGPTPVWLTPKFSIPVKKDKVNIGAGALLGTVLGVGEGSKTSFGIPYGTLTLGSRDKNISLGVGYAYAGGEWASSPTFTFSALVRTSQKGYFITENYFIGTSDSFVMLMMLGGRRIIGQKAGLDFGLVIPISKDIGSFVAVPWIGITIPFGRTQ